MDIPCIGVAIAVALDVHRLKNIHVYLAIVDKQALLISDTRSYVTLTLMQNQLL